MLLCHKVIDETSLPSASRVAVMQATFCAPHAAGERLSVQLVTRQLVCL